MNKTNIIYNRSQPIQIQNKNNVLNCGLKENIIDPNKNTPPNQNSWTKRLNNRFDYYYLSNKEQNFNME